MSQSHGSEKWVESGNIFKAESKDHGNNTFSIWFKPFCFGNFLCCGEIDKIYKFNHLSAQFRGMKCIYTVVQPPPPPSQSPSSVKLKLHTPVLLPPAPGSHGLLSVPVDLVPPGTSFK